MATDSNRDARARTGAGTIPAQTKNAPGPDTPLALGETGWRNTLRRAAREFVADRCPMTAGAWPITGSRP
jgi:hypothetical protein